MVDGFNTLSDDEQRQVAERLLRIKESGWKPFWCADPVCTGDPHIRTDDNGFLLYVDGDETHGPNGEPLGELDEEGDRPVLDPLWAHNHARQDQRLPPWLKPWIVCVLSGRGTGKTTTGVEFVTLSARKGLDGAIIWRRGTELENTHVATLIERAHPEFEPSYMASKDLIVWPNGAKTYLFSAERPENIRSVNLSYFWFDEFAFMDEVQTAWSNARLATRIEKPGNPIHILMTSTPTSTKFVMDMEDNPDVEIRRVSTYANKANLSPQFLEDLRKEHEGTRLGRQEIHGEVLRDVEGALWTDDLFKHLRCETLEDFDALLDSLDDIVLAVDPAGSKGPRSDATGIIGVGVKRFDSAGSPLSNPDYYVLCDATLKGTPTEWAAQVYRAARYVKANQIIVEKNYGGDMVKQVLADHAQQHPDSCTNEFDEKFRVNEVRASSGQSKEVRAEPTVGKYEQGHVYHVFSPGKFGDVSLLETEQVGWVPKSRGGRSPSPNRVDACVWSFIALAKAAKTQLTAANRSLLKQLNRR